MNRINREEAIKCAGVEFVTAVESENVEFSNRSTNGTADHGYVEFSATIEIDDDRRLAMFVLVDAAELGEAEELDQVDWDSAIKNASYEILDY